MIRNFADMLECIRQHQQGLLSDFELILALQCSPIQVNALLQMNALPAKVIHKTEISDWDEHVANLHERQQAGIDYDRSCLGAYIVGKTADGSRHAIICDDPMFATISADIISQGQGSVYMNKSGEIQVSGPFSKPENVEVLQALLEGKFKGE